MMYGNIAKKYDAFPELFIPLIRTSVIQSQAPAKHNTSFQSGVPIPSEISFVSLSTS